MPLAPSTAVPYNPSMPAFGRSMREHWPLDPDLTYLNHGTVGVVPRRVTAVKRALMDEIERSPSRFMLRELLGDMPAPWRPGPTRIREAAIAVAGFIGARPDDFAFTPNVTTAFNAVLRSIPFAKGDEILVTDLTYGAFTLASRHRAQETGAVVKVVEMPYPATPAAARDAIVGAAGPRTRLAVVDHITSESALLLPLAEIATALRAKGTAVFADGAHAPGAIDLDVSTLGVDWYGANLHKWCHAPRSCGFLWAPRAHHAETHPTVISWGSGQGFAKEFDWAGTTDPTNYLAAPEGIAMLREWGFEGVRDYMHGLAWEGARLLAERWDVEQATPEEMVGSMVTVPLPARAGSTKEDASNLRLALLEEDKIEIQLHGYRDRLWVRVSAQVYNDLDDVERLAASVLRRI